MLVKGLVFDHDGTLVDSEIAHFDCWRQTMLNHGIDISEQEYIEHHNGIPTLRNAQVFVDTYSLAVTAPKLAAEKQALFERRARVQPPPLMPSVLETLNLARTQGFSMAIATGADAADIARSLKAHDLTSYFTVTATRSDVDAGKPAPDVYLLACERLGLAPTTAVAFEDTAAGITAAKAAGLYCIAIPNAYSAQQDLSQADLVSPNLFEAYQHCLSVI